MLKISFVRRSLYGRLQTNLPQDERLDPWQHAFLSDGRSLLFDPIEHGGGLVEATDPLHDVCLRHYEVHKLLLVVRTAAHEGLKLEILGRI